MDVSHARGAGLDVPTLTVVAGVVTPGPRGRPHTEVRPCGTTSDALLALADGLRDRGVAAAALEATGVSWRPVWNVLAAAGVALLLANPHHLKAVPGRTTDARDGEGVADRRRHGRLRGRCVPARPQRELRDLVRSRTALLQERPAEVNRRHTTLEAANVKLAAVASDILGTSGRDILAALVAGVTDAAGLAGRRGKQRAALAVGHTSRTIASALRTRPTATYEDLGEHSFDQRARQAVERRLVHRLEALGYRVALEPLTA
jgi:transposase